MKIFTFVLAHFLMAPLASAAIPAFTSTQIREAILTGDRLPELIKQVETLPRRDQLSTLVQSLELQFPKETRIVHFADIPWLERHGANDATNSYQVQREFLTWWTTVRLNVVWQDFPFDIVDESDHSKFDWVMAKKLEMTPKGLFTHVPDEKARKLVEKLYVQGAPGILYDEGMIPALYTGTSVPLTQFLNAHNRNDDLVYSDLHELAAILKIEQLLKDVPEAHQSLVLLAAAEHLYELKYQNIPNLTFSTVLKGPAAALYSKFSASHAIKTEFANCADALGGLNIGFINL